MDRILIFGLRYNKVGQSVLAASFIGANELGELEYRRGGILDVGVVRGCVDGGRNCGRFSLALNRQGKGGRCIGDRESRL